MDSGAFSGVGEFLQWLMVGFIIMLLALIFIGVKALFSEEEIISDKPIVPEIRLVTDGKTVDTTYVYKLR